MNYYEMYNSSIQSNELSHNAIGGEYELYHHGVKGQKWGVRRAEKRAAKLAKRDEAARKAVEKHKTHGRAVAATVGKGVAKAIAADFLTGFAGGAIMGVGLSTCNPALIAAGSAFVGTVDTAYQLSNIYKTGRNIYDIGGVDKK